MSATEKQVVEVKLGGFRMTLDRDKLDTLSGFCDPDNVEIGEIHEMTDMLLDMCFGIYPSEADCLKYMKYLKCMRSDYEFLQCLGVKFDRDAERHG